MVQVTLVGGSGTPALERQLSAANALLVSAGLEEHREPSLGLREFSGMRCTHCRIEQSWLESLQRFCAHTMRTPGCVPEPLPNEPGMGADTADPHDDGVMDEVLARGCRSHLLCHAPEGLFVPVPFEAPIYDVEGSVPGSWLGSSQQLLEEIVALSPPLGINLRPLRGRVARLGGGFDISADTAAGINALAAQATRGDDGPAVAAATTPYWREHVAWFALYEAARLSVRHGTAIALL
eukprot:g3933.t1